MSAELIERLYAVRPEGFVTARTEAVAAARAAGDAATAREIAGLRKPTVAAWLVNLLAIRRPDLVAGLAELAGELRQAQRELRGPELRELTGQRREVVAALVAQARDLARAEAPGLAANRLPLAEVESTLHAALADPEVAEQVRAGRLLRAVSYAGFGEVPRPQLRLISGAGPESVPRDRAATAGRADRKAERAAEATRRAEREAAEASRQAERRRELDRELAQATAEQQRTEAELARSVTAERGAVERLEALTAELVELERRRAEAEHEVTRRKLARKTAERAASAAARHREEIVRHHEEIQREIRRRPGRPPD